MCGATMDPSGELCRSVAIEIVALCRLKPGCGQMKVGVAFCERCLVVFLKVARSEVHATREVRGIGRRRSCGFEVRWTVVYGRERGEKRCAQAGKGLDELGAVEVDEERWLQ